LILSAILGLTNFMSESINNTKPILIDPSSEVFKTKFSKVKTLCTDVDDTITTEGDLTSEAYDALWRAKKAGLRVIIVTGRPAGWADLMARFWPVDGVVAENGALVFYKDFSGNQMKLKRFYVADPKTVSESQTKLDAIKEEVLDNIEGAAVAFDQPFRLFDLAIDFSEDVKPLSEDKIQEICEVFKKHGATYKVSSIHVNGWFGDFDKNLGLRAFFEKVFNEDFDSEKDFTVYSGDSPNDEPLFKEFPLSVGVANVNDFLDSLEHPPAFITKSKSGEGFVELVDSILALRS
jgi:HAD superfamily hydrolase (TIGR01484 family)